MLNGYVIISVIVAIAFLILGAFVYSRNSKSRLNRLFVLFSTCLSIWLVSNYLAGDPDVPHNIALVANRLVFVFGGASTLAILLFIKQLSHRAFNKFEKVILGLNVISIVDGFTPLIVEGVYVEGNTYLINFGWLSNVYFLTILLNAILISYNLIKARQDSSGPLRAQLYVIQISFVAGLAAIIITNVLLPFAFGYFGLTNSGSFFSAFFVVGIAYAILKHKLFDLRLIIARALAYALLLSAMFGIYAVLVIFISQRAVSASDSFISELIPFFAAILIAFTYRPLKRFFDLLTNKFFYRDAYEPQVFLDQLNRTLVTTVDIEALLQSSTKIIEENLKSQFCTFAIRETAYTERRIIGNGNKKFDEEDIAKVREVMPKIHHRVIVVDDLPEESAEFAARLRKYDIAIIARLVTTLKYEVEGAGYLILGPKKSGNPYNKQDINIVRIIANELVIAIQNALRFEEIEKFNITLQEKVDDATKKLRHTNEKLKQMDETKDEFISMASHQLRTPLTSVKGYLSMVLEGDAGDIGEMQRKLLDQAFVSSQRMVYLIADLLNVSRLRTGKFIIEPVVSNLAEVVEGEIGQLKETAAGRGLTLTYDKPADFPPLYLDETKIRQVIMNFTDNAIYYTPSGGHINVKLEDKGDSIEFTVTDDGMGVPKSEQPHLFTKFYRAGNAKKARPDGTGLGLFMAKKVIVTQGGSLIFTSQEGKGSTFGFSFPKSKLQVPSVKAQGSSEEGQKTE